MGPVADDVLSRRPRSSSLTINVQRHSGRYSPTLHRRAADAPASAVMLGLFISVTALVVALQQSPPLPPQPTPITNASTPPASIAARANSWRVDARAYMASAPQARPPSLPAVISVISLPPRSVMSPAVPPFDGRPGHHHAIRYPENPTGSLRFLSHQLPPSPPYPLVLIHLQYPWRETAAWINPQSRRRQARQHPQRQHLHCIYSMIRVPQQEGEISLHHQTTATRPLTTRSA